MTKLREDGYLVTDDPVVAACFLGCVTDDGKVTGVHWTKPQIAVDGNFPIHPILIPARTVAEVCTEISERARVINNLLWDIMDKDVELVDWLSEHAMTNR